MKCICGKEFKNYVGIATHAAKAHGFSAKQSFVAFRNDGQVPKCVVENCQIEPGFKGSTRGFSKYCVKHMGAWQKGLTSQTDERIKARGEKISAALLKPGVHWSSDDVRRSHVISNITKSLSKRPRKLWPLKYPSLSKGFGWSKGLTRENDPRIAAIGDAVSNAIKKRGGSWSKGLTRDTDVRLARLGDMIRLSHAEVLERFARLNDKFILLDDVSTYFRAQSQMRVMCVKCKKEQSKSLHGLEHGDRCISCNPTSRQENVINDLLKSFGLDFEKTRSVIPPLELDAFVPSKMVAIEHNGLYWHSEKAGYDSKRHQKKTDACHEAGIQLMHVFEDELRDKLDIVASMLRVRLHIGITSVNARSLTAKEIDESSAKTFFNATHIDGYSRAMKTFALVSDTGDVMAALSLRKPYVGRKKKDTRNMIEICRFSSALNHVIRGGLSKLLSRAVLWSRSIGFTSIITYADQRWGKKSHAYEAVGFKRILETQPRFWWSDNVNRFNRMKFRARNGKSQAQVAESAGVSRIWGCKNTLYELKI